MDKNIRLDSLEIIKNLGVLNERFSGKSILLTGGGGFLGAQFVHYFLTLNETGILENPCKLYCFDNYMRGVPNWLQNLNERSDISITQSDIITESKFPSSDFIIHAASIASPSFYRMYPLQTMDANVIGLRNLLNFSVENPCESFLFFSTSEIYGDPISFEIPTKESYRGNVSCTGPRACYDESKRYGETLCITFAQHYNVPVKIARPFNNYGPGLQITDKRVLPDFFSDVLNDKNITLLSDGKATRTFCYISDAITGYLQILLSNFNGEPFNIGIEKPEISMLELANLVIKLSGKNLEVVYQKSDDNQYLIDNPQRRCPNIEKARTLLNYNPKVSLEEGLYRTLNYYLKNIK